MKFFYRQFFIAVLFCGFAFNAKAVNDTLTLGEAFDWQVGDSLVYSGFEYIYFPPPPQGSGYVEQHGGDIGFVVSARSNSPDAIKYVLDWTNGNSDTVIISNLDSLITKFSYSTLYPYFGGCQYLEYSPTCDSSYVNCSFQSCCPLLEIDTFVVNDINYNMFETGNRGKFVEKIGLVYFEYSALEYWQGIPYTSGGCGIELVYYKSAATGFMYSDVKETKPLQPSFHLTPNPATDQFTITADNQTPVTISIYSATGVLMGSYLKPAAGALSIPVNNLPPAYYLLKLSSGDGLSAARGFIVVR